VEPLVKATVIDGIAATEDRDSQGEILKLSGADISQMTTKGYFNDNHGTGFLNTLGRITEAKKIFKQDDCETDRQKMFWQQKKRPFLYVKGYLFDDADHPNAKAVGAIMKEFQKMGTPLDVKYSVEGKVLDRASYDRSVLAQSMVRNVALTLVPANGETAAAVAGRINKSMDMIKSERGGAVAACVERMVKSIAAGVQPQNRWDIPTEEERAEALLKKIVELTNLMKAKTAGVKWKKHSDAFHVSEDGKYIISRRAFRVGHAGERRSAYHFDVTHYPEGQSNTKNYNDLGHKNTLKDAKAHVEAHAAGKLQKGDVIDMGSRRGKPQGPAAGGKATVIPGPTQATKDTLVISSKRTPKKSSADLELGRGFVDRVSRGTFTPKDAYHSRAWQHHMERGGDKAGMGNKHADAHYRMAHHHAAALGMDAVGMESYVGFTPRKKMPRKFTPHPADHLVEKDPYQDLNKMTSPGYGGAGAPAQLTGGAALASKDPRRKHLKEVIKSVLAMNPGVSLAKALEMTLAEFRKRYG